MLRVLQSWVYAISSGQLSWLIGNACNDCRLRVKYGGPLLQDLEDILGLSNYFTIFILFNKVFIAHLKYTLTRLKGLSAGTLLIWPSIMVSWSFGWVDCKRLHRLSWAEPLAHPSQDWWQQDLNQQSFASRSLGQAPTPPTPVKPW